MNEPVDHFCRMLSAFEHADTEHILNLTCFAVGCHLRPTGITPGKDVLLIELRVRP